MEILDSATFWILLAAASEIIALSPLRDNSVIEVILHALNAIKTSRR